MTPQTLKIYSQHFQRFVVDVGWEHLVYRRGSKGERGVERGGWKWLYHGRSKTLGDPAANWELVFSRFSNLPNVRLDALGAFVRATHGTCNPVVWRRQESRIPSKERKLLAEARLGVIKMFVRDPDWTNFLNKFVSDKCSKLWQLLQPVCGPEATAEEAWSSFEDHLRQAVDIPASILAAFQTRMPRTTCCRAQTSERRHC